MHKSENMKMEHADIHIYCGVSALIQNCEASRESSWKMALQTTAVARQ
jgi:hypothetical protein